MVVLSKRDVKTLIAGILFSAGSWYLVVELRNYLQAHFQNTILVGIGLIIVSIVIFGKDV